jgi:hypothetical protein
MNLIEGQLKRTKEKQQDVEMTSGYIPSDSVSDCRSEKTEDSTDHMQDELLLVSPFFLSSFSLLLLDFCDL